MILAPEVCHSTSMPWWYVSLWLFCWVVILHGVVLWNVAVPKPGLRIIFYQIFGDVVNVDESIQTFNDRITDDVDFSVAVIGVEFQEKSLGVRQIFAETLLSGDDLGQNSQTFLR